jgi:hypothetical protein
MKNACGAVWTVVPRNIKRTSTGLSMIFRYLAGEISINTDESSNELAPAAFKRIEHLKKSIDMKMKHSRNR